MFVAGRNQKIIRDGKTVELHPGDPFPEAADAPTLRALVNTGFVVFQVPDAYKDKLDAASMQSAIIGGLELKNRAKAEMRKLRKTVE